MNVNIDGVDYVPAGESRPQIGVGITTRNRRETFDKSYAEIVRLTPGAKIVVVDDASDTPVPEADYRFEENVGIARAKNKCLELLDDCEHIFLFDDDTFPLKEDWWQPYVDSPEPHLMLLWVHPVIASDDMHVARYNPQGAMLYFDRKILDVVGGFDPVFGLYGSEHGDLSNRIHSFGLTTWRYADVVGSEDLFYCHDRDTPKFKSTVSDGTKENDIATNRPLRLQRQNSALYVDYREKHNVVVTHLLTTQPDHKYKKRWEASTSVLATLRKSVNGHRFVVLHDELTETSSRDMELVKCSTQGLNPYLQRWVCSWKWLRDNPDVEFVWFVDGSDVEMLRDPFPEMKRGVLYVGSEPATLDKPWMLENHKNPFLQEFLKENADNAIVNAGVVGGDRGTVLNFLHTMVRIIWDNRADLAMNPKGDDLGIGDMGLFNYVVYTYFSDIFVTGPRVHTVFKGNEKKNDWSWWRHK